MEGQYPQQPRTYGPHQMKMTIQPSHHSDNDRSRSELRALDCNLTSLCDHIQMEGFNSGSFSDIVVHAMGSTYHLHRLILSRSSYFRNMLHGPWKEASSPIVNLHVDDKNVSAEAIAMALAYLYGHHPKLNDNNAFRVLAAASFLDLQYYILAFSVQDLCAICTDFIISELWTSNFLAYQVMFELLILLYAPLHASRMLGIEEYFCNSGAFCKTEHSEQGNSSSEIGVGIHSDSSKAKGKNLVDSCSRKRLESELGRCLQDELKSQSAAHGLLVELIDSVDDFQVVVSDSKQSNLDTVQPCDANNLH
ncbi:hypothetical protein GH714_018786 [Hevea brasiliensis]|uniref:BTB domain-containing protein n=1 Tax=Hevea brasiliensis TaxID=3981 RepID=A0A6A6MG42_HEVBR|nr:hypothetical protein GH714_018786 [Hevea brasiliensis]